MKHQHGEAFCLMRYTCVQCNLSEVYWNSRDGVTSFVVCCPTCSENMLHVNWQDDQYVPDHVPEPGQGVWIDMPESLKGPAARARVARFDGTKFEIQGDKREQAIQAVINTYEPGTPWLIRW